LIFIDIFSKGQGPQRPSLVSIRFYFRNAGRGWAVSAIGYFWQGDFTTVVVAYSAAYHSLMVDEVRPLEKRIMERPATSWTDVVELAEVSWWGASRTAEIGMAITPRRRSSRQSYPSAAGTTKSSRGR
jgi:hypothetical protein